MDKITQKKNEKYSNLISAAYELFEKDGIGGVSIDDIVKKQVWRKARFICTLKIRWI